MSSRHRGRSLALMCLYQIELVSAEPETALKFLWYDKQISEEESVYAKFLVRGAVSQKTRIESLISAHSTNWDFSRISIVNRCILSLSIVSFILEKELAATVVIDEALELTREFEAEESIQFINGVLDAICKKEFMGKTD